MMELSCRDDGIANRRDIFCIFFPEMRCTPIYGHVAEDFDKQLNLGVPTFRMYIFYKPIFPMSKLHKRWDERARSFDPTLLVQEVLGLSSGGRREACRDTGDSRVRHPSFSGSGEKTDIDVSAHGDPTPNLSNV